MLNENVKKLLKENMWDLATCSAGVPNAVPVAFKDVTDDGNAFLDDPYHMKGSFLKNKDWYSFLLFTVTWDFGPRCRTCNNAKNIDNIQ